MSAITKVHLNERRRTGIAISSVACPLVVMGSPEADVKDTGVGTTSMPFR